MESKIESMEKSVVTISFVISPERVEEGMNYSYNKNRGKANLPGFRKGKAPRALLERTYGTGFLLDDAIDYVFPDAYDEIVKTHELSPVARPEIDSLDYDKEKGLSMTVKVTVKPEVKLGKYKGINYKDMEIEVSDSDIDSEVEKDREKNARIITVERPAENGDTAVIDFEGSIDSVPFEGGKGENYGLVLGSHSFIDTFEEQLIGKSAGDTLDVSVTFPEDYGQPDLAGKPAVFNVSIKEITTRELPALDDDFAQDVSEFDTFDEYKKSIKEKLIHQKEHQKEHDIEDELIMKATEAAEIDLPEVMVNQQVERMLYEFENRLRMQGLDLNSFLNYSGQSPDSLRETYREPAERNVRARLVLEKIAETEGLTASEDEITDEINRIAQGYGIEEDKMREMLRDDDIKGLEDDIKTRRAMEFIKENAVAEK